MATTRIHDSYKMPFGKYQGWSIGDVPATYLDWARDQEWIINHVKVMQYIDENRKLFDQELEESQHE